MAASAGACSRYLFRGSAQWLICALLHVALWHSLLRVRLATAARAGSTVRWGAQLGGISQWNTALSNARLPRVWDAATLSAGLAHGGALNPAMRVLQKLDSNKPITVAIFGSSMVKTGAGCFHSSEDALWQHGIVPNPTIYTCGVRALEELHTIGCDVGKGGFMTSFMQTINYTWPHVDHIMFNQGKSGVCLDTMYKTSCMDALTPKEVDIVILDTVTIGCSMEGGEAMLRDMLLRPSQPLVILFSNGRSCEKAYASGEVQQAMQCSACLKHLTGGLTEKPPGVDSMEQLCGLPLASKHVYTTSPTGDNSKVPGKLQYSLAYHGHMRKVDRWQQLAKHYNVAHLNMHAVMAKIMQQADKLLQKANLARRIQSEMQLLSEFYIDHVHYNTRRWGGLLAADLLVYYLAWAQRQLMTPDALNKKPNPKQWPLNTSVLFGNAGVQYQSECFGLNLEAATHGSLNPASVSNAPVSMMQGLPAVKPTGPDEDATWDPRTWAGRTLSPYPPLPVLEANDFYMQVFHVGARGEVKLKPGYHAQKAGAKIVFEVDTSFAGRDGKANRMAVNSTEVWIAYLKSYKVWGIAQVSCLSGCWCAPAEANALSDEDTSVTHVLPVPVTPHPACRMALEVLARTHSEGHTFKLLSVSVRMRKPAGRVSAA